MTTVIDMDRLRSQLSMYFIISLKDELVEIHAGASDATHLRQLLTMVEIATVRSPHGFVDHENLWRKPVDANDPNVQAMWAQPAPNIFFNASGYYFTDETQSDLYGPYPTLQAAQRGLSTYETRVVNGVPCDENRDAS